MLYWHWRRNIVLSWIFEFIYWTFILLKWTLHFYCYYFDIKNLLCLSVKYYCATIVIYVTNVIYVNVMFHHLMRYMHASTIIVQLLRRSKIILILKPKHATFCKSLNVGALVYHYIYIFYILYYLQKNHFV